MSSAQKMSNSPHSYIAIEGVIGAGKTTYAQFLAHSFQAKILLEEYEENPFLAKFYGDAETYGFPLELSFLASRYHQVKYIIEKNELFHDTIISDFVLYKSLVFASINLKGDELELYKKLFQIMFQQIPVPDLTIYIYHTVDQLRQNILKRGRPYEQAISNEYLEMLNENYLSYFKQLAHHRIVVIDGKNMNIIDHPTNQSRLLEIASGQYPLGVTYV